MDKPEKIFEPQRFRRAWLLFGLILLANIIVLALAIANPTLATSPGWGLRGFPSTLSLSFSFLGALILVRYPRHPIPWLFFAAGSIGAVQALLQEYSFFAVFSTPNPAGGVLAAWVVNWIWVLLMLVFFLILLLFPTGRLSSRRWRLGLALAGANFLLMAVSLMLIPGPMTSSIPTLSNPFGMERAQSLLGALFYISNGGFILSLLAAAWNLITRFRRSQGGERQQIKWLVYAVVLIALTAPTAGLDFPWHLPFMAAIVFLPISAAIAIFRYRLYDIDVIIRGTLSYTVLTGILALVYFGIILLSQNLLVTITGQRSQFVVVISTLTIAALFSPLRVRVQDFIDQRFYRAKYDAEQTLARFAATARDEVDMQRLSEALLTVVDETMQPAQASLWLRRSQSERAEEN